MITIAIDGPAGAGKSTIAKIVASTLGVLYLDTGAMYRAMALKAIRMGINPGNEDAVEEFLPDVDISVRYIDGTQHTFLDGEDVSTAIRQNEVSAGASAISAIPAVRLKLVDMQRQIASEQSMVLDGRDITSYVLPNAKHKFYLDATPEERARRRHAELSAKGINIPLPQILTEIIQRDYNDSHRDFAPLTRTADSVYVDSSHLSVDEVAGIILRTVEESQ